MNDRLSWPETWMSIANTISNRSYDPGLKVGAIIVSDDNSQMLSIGYNGNYKGGPHFRESSDPGKSGFIHAEVNMIAKFREYDPENYIVLLTLSPCKMCTKILVNSGFKYIFWVEDYREQSHLHIFDECGIKYGNLETFKKIYEEEIK